MTIKQKIDEAAEDKAYRLFSNVNAIAERMLYASAYKAGALFGAKLILEEMQVIQDKVNAQAEDEGLWFIARYATEAYLQQELRELHRVVEQLNKLKGEL